MAAGFLKKGAVAAGLAAAVYGVTCAMYTARFSMGVTATLAGLQGVPLTPLVSRNDSPIDFGTLVNDRRNDPPIDFGTLVYDRGGVFVLARRSG